MTNVTLPTGEVSGFHGNLERWSRVEVEASTRENFITSTNLSASDTIYMFRQGWSASLQRWGGWLVWVGVAGGGGGAGPEEEALTSAPPRCVSLTRSRSVKSDAASFCRPGDSPEEEQKPPHTCARSHGGAGKGGGGDGGSGCRVMASLNIYERQTVITRLFFLHGGSDAATPPRCSSPFLSLPPTTRSAAPATFAGMHNIFQ